MTSHTNIYTWYCVNVPTNLAINDKLLEDALRVGGFSTKKDTVNAALQEFIERRKQREILALFGSIDYRSSYSYKAARARKPK